MFSRRSRHRDDVWAGSVLDPPLWRRVSQWFIIHARVAPRWWWESRRDIGLYDRPMSKDLQSIIRGVRRSEEYFNEQIDTRNGRLRRDSQQR